MEDVQGFSYRDFGAMVAAYLDAALWSSTDETSDDGGEPFDRNFSARDLDADAVQGAAIDCAAFLAIVQADPLLLGFEASDLHPAGHDFWLTRNGHGAGFWDGDWAQGDALTAVCKRFGEVNLYLGDGGWIGADGGGEAPSAPRGRA